MNHHLSCNRRPFVDEILFLAATFEKQYRIEYPNQGYSSRCLWSKDWNLIRCFSNIVNTSVNVFSQFLIAAISSLKIMPTKIRTALLNSHEC